MAETIYTKNAPDAIGPYSQAKKVGGLVFTSGQIAIDPAVGDVTAKTIEEQTHQVCKNLSAVLEAAGSSLDKAVKTVCFLKNMSDFAAFNAVYGTKYTTVKDCILYCIKQVNALLGTNYTKAAQIVEIVSFDDEKYVQRKQEISDKIDALYEKISIEGRMEDDFLGSYGYEDVTAYQWLTVYAPAGTEAEESCKISGVPFVSTTPVDNSPLGKLKAFIEKVKAFFEDIIAKLTAPFQLAKLVLESKLQNG